MRLSAKRSPSPSTPDTQDIEALAAECAAMRVAIGALISDLHSRLPVGWLLEMDRDKAIAAAANIAGADPQNPHFAAAIDKLRAAVRNPRSFCALIAE